MQKWRVKLADYDKQIVYKKGILNTSADALSRIEYDVNVVFTGRIDKEMMVKLQSEDTSISSEIELLKSKNTNAWNNMLLEDNILYCTKHLNGEKIKRIVIPKSLIDTVLTTCHDDMAGGHFGMEKTWPKLRDSYWWSTMYNDTKNWVKPSKMCAERKSPRLNYIPSHLLIDLFKE